MKTRLLKTWRDRIQPIIAGRLAEAEKLGLAGRERERLVRPMPASIKGSSWIGQMWRSEMRKLFGPARAPRTVPVRPGRLPLTFE